MQDLERIFYDLETAIPTTTRVSEDGQYTDKIDEPFCYFLREKKIISLEKK